MPRLILAVLFLSFCAGGAHAQATSTLVIVTAEVTEAPPAITLNWLNDGTAPFYRILRKSTVDEAWQLLAALPGNATQYSDGDVSPGTSWEYAVVRTPSYPIVDTVCLGAGTTASFHIQDAQSDGLCCTYSQGGWSIEMCGGVVAQGAEYGANDDATFTVCGTGACTNVIVRIEPDHYPGDITWQLQNGEHVTVAQGGGYVDPGFGYVKAGIRAEPVHDHGTILLLVQAEVAADLSEELDRLRIDLIKDGWKVRRSDVAMSATPPQMKALVLAAAAADPDLSALLLIGDLPVAYSGKISPDGHPDHKGAWPADVYYAELDGPWTDGSVTATGGSLNPRTVNVPGDGKFDQSSLPSDVDLMMGRIDFSDLPVFVRSPTELLRAYLDRDHRWRAEAPAVPRRALMDFNFEGSDYDAPFRRGAAAMFGADQISSGDYFNALEQGGYLWALGAGPGSYNGALHVGTSSDFAFTTVQATFSHLFGSYFADWDTPDNFLRSGLASGTMLGTVWGRQHLVFHPMALGATIGECIKRTQNATYNDHFQQGRLVETALMGDPTLTAYPVRPATQLVATSTTFNVGLNWNAPDATDIVGYHVYRQVEPDDGYTRLTDAPVVPTNWTDAAPVAGELRYMVRAVKLETSASGTFYTLSAGVIDTTHFISGTIGMEERSPHDLLITPNPCVGTFTVQLPTAGIPTGVELYDLRGCSVPVNYSSDGVRLQVGTSAEAGSYILWVRTAAERYMARVLVQ